MLLAKENSGIRINFFVRDKHTIPKKMGLIEFFKRGQGRSWKKRADAVCAILSLLLLDFLVF